MKLRHWCLLSFLFFSEVAFSQNILSWNFDWDDNIFYMPTKIVLIPPSDDLPKVEVSTQDFAIIRQEMKDGVFFTGKFKGYKFDADPTNGSLKFFFDSSAGPSENYFLSDVNKAMIIDFEAAKGPSWHAFVTALSTPETAAWTSIITARGHYPASIHEALRKLKDLGLFANVPKLENIYAVSNPDFGGNAASPSAAKVEVQKQILDRIEAQGLNPRMTPVLNQNGDGDAPLHMWGFSDDDYGNYSTTRDSLKEEVAKGRWPNVKIVLFYTGVNNPKVKPEITVIKTDGTIRKSNRNECDEVARVLYSQYIDSLRRR